MKILWVKAGGLVPLDTGGKIRSYHLLKELARKHEVTFFTFYSAHPNDAHRQLERLFARVVCWPLRLPAVRSLADHAGYARHLFSHEPYAIGKYCRPEVRRGLGELLQAERYDIIVCDFVVAAGVIPWDLPCPKVLFAHNVEALIWQRHYQTTCNPLWKVVCWREYRAMARAERCYLQRADHVLSVSDTDRDFFAQYIDPAKITVIPTGVDVDYFRPTSGSERPNMLVFTGSMDWLPNEDAVFYFVHQILPRIRRHIPEVTLWVVGRSPSQRLQALAARDNGVQITGRVEDVRPYLREACVYVVPLRIGSGTRLKIFEAMATGKAVVATSVGAEGLPVKHGENIMLADEPEVFARRVITLLGKPVVRLGLGLAARQLVEQKHSWASSAAHFDAVLAMMVRKSSERFAEIVNFDRLGDTAGATGTLEKWTR